MALYDIPLVQMALDKTPAEMPPGEFVQMVEKAGKFNGYPVDGDQFWQMLRGQAINTGKTWRDNLTRMQIGATHG